MMAKPGGENEGAGMDELIGRALADVAGGVERVAPGCWRVTLATQAEPWVTVRMGEGWLLFDAPLSPELSLPRRALQDAGNALAADAVWELLASNATLAGGTKLVVVPDEGCLHLRAELPLDVETPVQARILQTYDGIGTVVRGLRGGTAHRLGECDAAGGVRDRLPRLCEDAGWGFTQRPDARLAVDLGMPDALCQAVVEEDGVGRVRASVDLVAGDSPSPPVCRQAVGLLLLRASGAIRMVRAAADPMRGGSAARFEVVFAWEPCATELAHALSALSVACRLHGREAAFLQRDEVVAEAYLRALARDA